MVFINYIYLYFFLITFSNIAGIYFVLNIETKYAPHKAVNGDEYFLLYIHLLLYRINGWIRNEKISFTLSQKSKDLPC